MRDQLAGIGIDHSRNKFKPLHDRFLAVGFIVRYAGLNPGLLVSRYDRRMAMQTSSRLLDDLDPFGDILIGEHISVPPLLPIIYAKGVAGKNIPPNRVFIEFLEGFASAVAGSFDIDRSPNEHVAFGFGTHFCLGNSLARLELRVMFDRLLDRLPDLELVEPGEPAYRPANFVSGYEKMPVRFTPVEPVGAVA